eukprot:7053847-Pyramimonas_sp.AAC.1
MPPATFAEHRRPLGALSGGRGPNCSPPGRSACRRRFTGQESATGHRQRTARFTAPSQRLPATARPVGAACAPR